jgi:hypothetical protein
MFERSAAGPGAFRHTSSSALGSRQFRRKPPPGLGGLLL